MSDLVPDPSLPESLSATSDLELLRRWRLMLGRFAEDGIGTVSLTKSRDADLDRVLESLYGREYRQRGVRDHTRNLDSSQLNVPLWLREVRELFPNKTAEIIQQHALERYQMQELVTDPKVLEQLEPSYELLKSVLTFRGLMRGAVLDVAKEVVRTVVRDLTERLTKQTRQRLIGKLNRKRPSQLKVLRNLNWKRTIRDNLRYYDPAKQQLVLGKLHFFSRVDRHLPWHLIMAVDCSGSMIDSVIHSAVMASIFHHLPAVNVSLLAFDTSIVDLSDQVDDPTEVLMSVQLGGGTNIGGAIAYCESLVAQPSRTIVIFVTDFREGADPKRMLSVIARLKEGGVRVLGLAALDQEAKPSYDEAMAEACVAAGAEVAALTPEALTEWIGNILA